MKNKIELQQGYIDLIKEHSLWMKYAITFTFKSSVFIENKELISKEESFLKFFFRFSLYQVVQ
jgi:hypothetical protein